MAQNSSANGYGRAGVWASIVIASLSVIGGIIYVGSMANQLSDNTRDIAALNTDISDLKRDASTSDSFRARTCQEFGKVETQVGAIQDDINLMRVDDIRFRGIIFPKLFQQEYPSPFYAVSIPREMPTCN